MQGWTANGESERHLSLSDCAIGVEYGMDMFGVCVIVPLLSFDKLVPLCL